MVKIQTDRGVLWTHPAACTSQLAIGEIGHCTPFGYIIALSKGGFGGEHADQHTHKTSLILPSNVGHLDRAESLWSARESNSATGVISPCGLPERPLTFGPIYFQLKIIPHSCYVFSSIIDSTFTLCNPSILLSDMGGSGFPAFPLRVVCSALPPIVLPRTINTVGEGLPAFTLRIVITPPVRSSDSRQGAFSLHLSRSRTVPNIFLLPDLIWQYLGSKMGLDLLPQYIRKNYEVYEWRHACAILRTDFPQEWDDLTKILALFKLPRSMIVRPGGNKSPISNRINGEFESRGWKTKQFDVRFVVDGRERLSPTHKVDYFKNRIAVETEWNNKDPFYDRDLNNFRLLFELGIISVGIIITRSTELQEIFDQLGKGASYGASTTHTGKLLPKVEGGGPGGCPLLAFGIRRSLYDPNA